MQSLRKIAVAAMTALMLLSCQSFTPQPTTGLPAATAATNLASDYQQHAASGGSVYAIDPVASDIRIYVFRAGTAASLGHNHILSVTEIEGFVHLPSELPSQARFDLRVPLESLVVDDPRLRAETGGNFAGERSASDIAGTRRNMLGPRGLDAAQYPFIDFKSVTIAGDWPVLLADVAITLHGVTRQQPVFLRVRRSNTEVKVSGSLVLRQTEFGITPYSLFGGLMAVQDDVAIEFELGGGRVEF